MTRSVTVRVNRPSTYEAWIVRQAKNPAIILPDADIDNVAVSECLLGSLSYNGQRCTALKIIFVHESVIGNFLPKFIKAVDTLPMGLPWVSGVKITPLPEEGKPGFLKELIDDAISKGAKIANPDRGNKFDRTFVAPTILTGVTSAMRIYNEEQFGPLVPVVSYRDISEIYDYLAQSPYGQQAAVFGKDTLQISALVDDLVNQASGRLLYHSSPESDID
jgi:glyceraldehyde-3-phosphate dehydrogenase (NADP+)